jgi:hypothetical protein
LAATAVPAGGTKLAPNAAGVGATVDLGGHYGAIAIAKFTNGSTGPTLAAGATIYGSHDGVKWFEINTVWGDLVSSGAPQSQPVPVDAPIRYVRADAWGNTGQAVTVEIWVLYTTAI